MNRHKFSGNNRVFLKAARSLFTLFLASLMAVSAVAPSIPARAASGNMQITPIDFGDTGNWGDSTMVSSGGKNLLMDTYIKDKYDTLVNYLDDHHFLWSIISMIITSIPLISIFPTIITITWTRFRRFFTTTGLM